MKPYFSAQLDALNETGRPLNRPLMWDFPEDPMTWKLAEGGIGDKNSSSGSNSTSPHALSNGDFVVLSDCANTWNQLWNISMQKKAVCMHLTASVAATKCLDNGGAPGGNPPDGPYPIHMWGSGFASSQDWVYDGDNKQLSDPAKKSCLSAAGDGTHPSMAKCDTTDSKQQWSFTPGGVVENAGMCLTVISQESTTEVADQCRCFFLFTRFIPFQNRRGLMCCVQLCIAVRTGALTHVKMLPTCFTFMPFLSHDGR